MTPRKQRDPFDPTPSPKAAARKKRTATSKQEVIQWSQVLVSLVMSRLVPAAEAHGYMAVAANLGMVGRADTPGAMLEVVLAPSIEAFTLEARPVIEAVARAVRGVCIDAQTPTLGIRNAWCERIRLATWHVLQVQLRRTPPEPGEEAPAPAEP